MVEIILAIISLLGTVITVIVQNRKTQALILYRVDQIEKRCEEHWKEENDIIERTYELEKDVSVIKEKISNIEKLKEVS